jgi:hypothetical protein
MNPHPLPSGTNPTRGGELAVRGDGVPAQHSPDGDPSAALSSFPSPGKRRPPCFPSPASSVGEEDERDLGVTEDGELVRLLEQAVPALGE